MLNHLLLSSKNINLGKSWDSGGARCSGQGEGVSHKGHHISALKYWMTFFFFYLYLHFLLIPVTGPVTVCNYQFFLKKISWPKEALRHALSWESIIQALIASLPPLFKKIYVY
jgi:hypothetical protein